MNNKIGYVLMTIIILILLILCYLFATDKIIVNNKNTDNKSTLNDNKQSESQSGSNQNNKLNDNNDIKEQNEIYGTYFYTKTYFDNFAEVQRTINCKIELNEDGSALLEYSDGSIDDSTYGSFTKDGSKIIYISKYDYYNNVKTLKDNEESYEFDIVNDSELKSDYFNLTLTKQD